MKINLELFDYYLPKDKIAQEPIRPRDFSKLLIYDTLNDKIYFDIFLNLNEYLPQESFLVLNNTKVLPAKLEMLKETGGKVKILFLVDEALNKNSKFIRGLVNKRLNLGEKIYFPNNKKNFLKVISQEKNIFTFSLKMELNNFLKLLNLYGEAPLPPYIKNTPLTKKEAKEKYQTIFAKKLGSIAAPTASFHFTKRVFKKLEKIGIECFFITLHVGLGTFMPIGEENIKNKKLHKEYWEIETDVYKRILKLKQKKKLIAVGTTTTRLLETLARKRLNLNKKILRGTTELFIFPPFKFKMIDALITNFHLPKTSLMMLVEAFLQFKNSKRHLRELYEIAIKNDFRFYSFGDAMLII
jgi:S-adenosylmethionine:tRNA ribosyltransferase-isomerase